MTLQHKEEKHLFIHCEVPEGSVLTRQLPTKGMLPKSNTVDGAYEHRFTLQKGSLSVPVALHAKVRSRKELHTSLKWHMEKLPSTDGCLELLLSPAPKDARVTVCGFVPEGTSDPESVRVLFAGPEAMNLRGSQKPSALGITTRRTRLAEHQAARL